MLGRLEGGRTTCNVNACLDRVEANAPTPFNQFGASRKLPRMHTRSMVSKNEEGGQKVPLPFKS